MCFHLTLSISNRSIFCFMRFMRSIRKPIFNILLTKTVIQIFFLIMYEIRRL